MNSKTLNTKINNFIEEQAMDEEVLLADGLDEAFIGVAQTEGASVAVYNRDKIIEILMARDGIDYVSAVEFYSFKIEGAYVGEHTPLYIVPFNDSNPYVKEIERLKKELTKVVKSWKTMRDYGIGCPTIRDKDVAEADKALRLAEKKFGQYDVDI
jgi:hypothetical protein